MNTTEATYILEWSFNVEERRRSRRRRTHIPPSGTNMRYGRQALDRSSHVAILRVAAAIDRDAHNLVGVSLHHHHLRQRQLRLPLLRLRLPLRRLVIHGVQYQLRHCKHHPQTIGNLCKWETDQCPGQQIRCSKYFFVSSQAINNQAIDRTATAVQFTWHVCTTRPVWAIKLVSLHGLWSRYQSNGSIPISTHCDVRVETDECVSGPANAVEEGSKREGERHVLHALAPDHHFLQHKIMPIITFVSSPNCCHPKRFTG